ncbi:pilus assembly protein [Pseudomonas sp. PDM13]|uniref:pilus assembly protein n=1 Tax=Pseudomonas sp. PDM13 TaxID=2769255 RepID=UPI0021DFB956|nr:PilC/PilY family type IV pilus protein [Pseudomonas sp. PDM13]MCU9949162.1 PilC/PilY family type IV pilus protein [Pseudomonas sp. PDM13]
MSVSRAIQLFILLLILASGAARPGVMAQTPLFVSNIAPPMNMLVVGRDQKLYFPAYNDASDIDGDDQLDIYYKPAIDYTGYFDSYKCYTYDALNGVFVPASTTSTKKCTSATGRWSGDFLNYLSMSRLDVLRKVLYGGYRYTDSATSTVLERTFIPNDAHSWGKEYLSIARDGYSIADYTPLAVPTNGKYILFANTSIGSSTLSAYSNTAVPKLRIISSTNQSIYTYRIWGWVSRESPQATNSVTSTTNVTNTIVPDYDLTVRVRACVSGLLEANCTQYGSAYKPTGVLHDYGSADKMYFGMVTGTYSNNLRGGVVRKAAASFSNEFTSANGRFLTDATSGTGCQNARCYVNNSGIVANLDRLVFSAGCTSSSGFNLNPLTNGNCLDWGNPLGEMAYETLRYYAGKAPNSAYAAGTSDTSLGMSSLASWTNPYSTYPSCTKPFMTLMSDINPSYDSDVPGSSLGSDSKPTTDIGFDFAALGATLWSKEVGGSVSVNVGQSGNTSDSAPTAKSASSFATIRGLAEEPTRQGSYSASAVSYFGSQTALTTAGSNKVQSFSIALSSTLPNIRIKTSRGTLKLVPFSMNVSQSVVSQITGFYIDTLTNDSAGNLTSITFRVVYDDAAQGRDYDMDAIVLYTVTAKSDGTVDVTARTEYSVAGDESHMGYTMAGTTSDGVYLEVSGGGSGNVRNRLDTPDGRSPGDCASITCALLPGLGNNSSALSGNRPAFHTRNFTPSASRAVTTLQDPLWYAAKYGQSDLASWDQDGDGTPDNYFLVSDPSKLASQLKSAFDEILQLNSSVTAVAVDSQSTDSGSYVYSTGFTSADWSGDLMKKQKARTTTGGTTTTTGGTTTTTTTTLWRAAAQLGTPSSRNILFAKNGVLTGFSWANLTSTQQTQLNRNVSGTVDNLGQTRVGFLRGENSSFRTRASLIGDIINSSPVLVSGADYLSARADALEGSTNYSTFANGQASTSPVVYVGANDGMLHAFNASTGAELFAFIPSAVFSSLNALTASDYGQRDGTEHRYYVDGTPVVADVYYNSSWRKVLLGTLGGGGREVFALDITTPSSPRLLWEFTSDNDASLGYTVAKPTIARLHNGKWAALVPSGYDIGSTSASLLVIDIQTGALLTKLTATPTLATGETVDSLGNGLSRLYVADMNSDGIADYAYAGDLLGNLWRLDLIDTSATSPLTATAAENRYAVAFGGNPLYVARSAGGARQPITSAPYLIPHPSGTGYIVTFGTGRYLVTSDKTSSAGQSMYGIWDRRTAGQASTSSPSSDKVRANLQQQTLTASSLSGVTTYGLSGTEVGWYDSSGNTADSNVSRWGWYFDFTQTGERLIYDTTLYGSSLIFSSVTPQTGTCAAGLSGTVYAINPDTGGQSLYKVFDMDGDGTFDDLSGFVTDGGDITLSGGYTWGNSQLTNTLDGVATDTGAVTGRRTWYIQPANSN